MPTQFIVQRLLWVLPTVLAVVTVNFVIIHLAPGDPATLLIGQTAVSPEFLEQARRELGLDQPLHIQYVRYLLKLAGGDFGYSYWYKEPVLHLIVQRIPATLQLMISALTISLVLGTLGGLLAGRYAGRWLDTLGTVCSMVGYSAPVFWVGLILIILFSFYLDLFPLQGAGTPGLTGSAWTLATDRLQYLVLPSLTLATAELAGFFRFARTRTVEEVHREYVTTARGKGLSGRAWLLIHVLPNLLPTIVTLTGLRLGTIFGGALLTETTFAWPGIGRLMFEAMQHRDYPLIMGVFLLTGVMVILANLLTDIAYGFLDPRVRYR